MLYRLTYYNAGAFGGRPRQLSSLSAYSQPFIANDGKKSGPIPELMLFASFSFFSCFLFLFSTLLVRTPRSDVTNQAPIATVSTYRQRSHSRTEQPGISPAQSNKIQRYVLVDQAAECDTASQQTRSSCFAKSHLV